MPDQEHATTGQAGDAPEAGPRVLVVEDDTTSRLVVARQLDRLGVAATVVGDGTEAVEAVRQGRFDAVLMDRHLPGVDGLEATRRIRHLPGGRDLPVIAMTADTRPEHRRECLDAGVDDYLAKPLEMASLRETLWRWLPSPTNPGRRLDREALARVRDELDAQALFGDGRRDRPWRRRRARRDRAPARGLGGAGRRRPPGRAVPPPAVRHRDRRAPGRAAGRDRDRVPGPPRGAGAGTP